MLGVAADEGLDQGGLADLCDRSVADVGVHEGRGKAHAGRADDGHHDGWRLLGEPVDEGDMEALFVDLLRLERGILKSGLLTYLMRSCSLLAQSTGVREGKGFGIGASWTKLACVQCERHRAQAVHRKLLDPSFSSPSTCDGPCCSAVAPSRPPSAPAPAPMYAFFAKSPMVNQFRTSSKFELSLKLADGAD